MILAFFKEYKDWYIQYFILVVFYLLVFFLSHIPLYYFYIATLISITVLILISVKKYFTFKAKVDSINNFNYEDFPSELNSTIDMLYLKKIQKLVYQSEEDSANLKQSYDKLDSMIKMWVHQMKLPISALSLMEERNQFDPFEFKNQLLKLDIGLNQLLNYLKFSQNKDDYRYERVSVNEIIKVIIKQFRFLCISKNIRIDLEGDWQLTTDKKWLSFALLNIIVTAIKYSNKDGVIKININDSSISILDNGIGMLEEDIPRIFDEGYTGFNGHELQKASGLGLSMAKRILEELELSITLESELDCGTNVLIERKKV